METRFEFRDFIKVFALAIALYAIFATLLAWIPSGADFLESLHPSLSFLLIYLIQGVVFFFPLWVFVIGKYTASKEDFGLTKVKIPRLLKTVFGAYGIYLAVMFGLSGILTILGWELPGFSAQESYLPLFGMDPLGIAVALLVVGGIAPFIEEVLFRGFIYRIFVKTWPTWLGSLVSAVLFAMVHLQFQSFIPLLILGVLLNHCYQRTGSIWTSIVFHSMNNLLAFAVQVYISYNGTML